jgi:hypothetical protein
MLALVGKRGQGHRAWVAQATLWIEPSDETDTFLLTFYPWVDNEVLPLCITREQLTAEVNGFFDRDFESGSEG